MSASPANHFWFGHPPGLAILFLTEAWEKFSFFGMRALLVYYMTSELAIEQQQASLLYGAYSGAIFLTPLLGALISDRWLGRRRAIITGGLIMTVGHCLLALETMFYGSLAIIALGSGLFVPNLPSQIASLYQPTDNRRLSAYNIYYVGINLGGLTAPLVCGTIGELYGWHWGFFIAGIGMVAGLAIYIVGGRFLPPEHTGPLVTDRHEAGQVALGDYSSIPPYRLLISVAAAVVIFRAAYEQLGNTIAIWVKEDVDRMAWSGFTIPMTWFQSFNPLLVFVLTPLLLSVWARLAAKGHEPSPIGKMAFGATMAAGAYLSLAAISMSSGEGSTVWWPWVALFFMVMTTAELCLLPVGLALFAQLVPARRAATTIAAWFLVGFAGNILAGVLGALWSTLAAGWFFIAMAAVAATSALVFLWIGREHSEAIQPAAQSSL